LILLGLICDVATSLAMQAALFDFPNLLREYLDAPYDTLTR